MTYGDLNYTTDEINADLVKVHDKEALVEEAPSDGNQYGRKNGAWSVIEAGGTQYLDLSMFLSESGTLSDEDYQKVVKAYEDKISVGFLGIQTLLLSIYNTGDGGFYVSANSFFYGSEYVNISYFSAIISKDKTFMFESTRLDLNSSGSGTKALTDNGQYAEFAKPTKVVAGSSGTVTQQLSPNTLYKFGECSSLTVTLGAETSGIVNEYMFEFVSGSTATTLSVPSTVTWSGGEAPTIEASKTYQVSIVNNLAVFAAF